MSRNILSRFQACLKMDVHFFGLAQCGCTLTHGTLKNIEINY